MKLRQLDTNWRKNHTFLYQQGLMEYHCKVKYLPFGSENKEMYNNLDLSKIYTPVYHFEFKALNTKESIYQSHWIMPYSLAWFLENYPEPTIEDMVVYAAKENGYFQRIKEANHIRQRGTQLSIF